MSIQRRIVVGGGGGANLPFTASVNGDGEIGVTGGYYFQENVATAIAAVSEQSGTYVYVSIFHSSAGELDGSGPVEIRVSDTVFDYTVATTYITETNVLIAEVAGESIIQYRSGNFELVYGFDNGAIHYVPVFSGGDN